MNDILRTALTYLGNNDRLIYSYRGNTFLQGGELYDRDHDGRGRIDCSTLVHLALQGIPYDRSPYATGKTDAFFGGECLWQEGRKVLLRNVFAERGDRASDIRRAYGLARYCRETGLELAENEPLQPGDLVFFYSGAEADAINHKAVHMGIVVDTTEESLITIEGNVGPVSYREYAWKNTGTVLGYCRLPGNPDYRSIAGGRGMITFSGVIPEDAQAVIRPLTPEELSRYELPEGRRIFAFEAAILSEGKEIKPRGAIQVEIALPGVPQEGLQVIHIRETGSGGIGERYPVEMLTVSDGKVSFIDFSVARYIAVVSPDGDTAEQP